jgi:hypothetical protein
MKKLTLIFVLFAFSFLRSFQALAQKTDSLKYKTSGYIEVSCGIALPIQNFSVSSAKYIPSSTSNTTGFIGGSCYALPGGAVNIDFALPITHSQFTFAGSLGYCNNPFDINTFINTSMQSFNNPSQMGPLDWKTLSSNATSYSTYTFMLGAGTTLAFKKFSFESAVICGLAYCISPEVEYNATASWPAIQTNNVPIQYSVNSSNAFAFCIEAKIDIRYAINSHLFALANFAVMHAYPVYHVNTTYLNSTTVGKDEHYVIVSIPSFGIGYRLGK